MPLLQHGNGMMLGGVGGMQNMLYSQSTSSMQLQNNNIIEVYI
jgi:hypothetical protein